MKNNYSVLVLGAGVGGLGIGTWLKDCLDDFLIIEGNTEIPKNMCNGVHYLHSVPMFPESFSPDIKEITLTDGVLRNGVISHSPSLNDALEYSEKVREIQHPSSIFEVGSRKSVFLPSSNTCDSLTNDMFSYIGKDHFEFGWWVQEINPIKKTVTISNIKETQEIGYGALVSTIPLDKLLKLIGIKEFEDFEFKCNSIEVLNFRVNKIVPNWLINLYVPDRQIPVYRASVLNGQISMESIRKIEEDEFRDLIDTFGMFYIAKDSVERYTWTTGKIMSLSIDQRKRIVESLLPQSIFTIGRFGLWNRKLLIDSTINQAKMITDYFRDDMIGIDLINKLSK